MRLSSNKDLESFPSYPECLGQKGHGPARQQKMLVPEDVQRAEQHEKTSIVSLATL